MKLFSAELKLSRLKSEISSAVSWVQGLDSVSHDKVSEIVSFIDSRLEEARALEFKIIKAKVDNIIHEELGLSLYSAEKFVEELDLRAETNLVIGNSVSKSSSFSGVDSFFEEYRNLSILRDSFKEKIMVVKHTIDI